MPKSKSRKKKPPKRVLAQPDLEHVKTAVLNSLTSTSGQRTYDHAIREFVARLAFNRTVGSTAENALLHYGQLAVESANCALFFSVEKIAVCEYRKAPSENSATRRYLPGGNAHVSRLLSAT